MASQKIRPSGASRSATRETASPFAPRRFEASPAPEAEAPSPRQIAASSLLQIPVHPPGGEPEGGRLPGALKLGIENLSGFSLDHLKVHYNSPRPARVRALAYTAGSEIHVAPSQEKHLPHEAWHAVQQMQGRVRPTARVEGQAINDDPALEREASTMGARAARGGAGASAPTRPRAALAPSGPGAAAPVIQRVPGNEAYDEALEDLGDWDLEENYLDVVGRNTDENTVPAYIVNTIFSYREVDQIPAVIDAMVAGLRPNRIAVVLGINAPSNQENTLDQAIERAAKAISEYPFPVVIVRSTFPAGRPFPFGTMRNQVMHSPETRALTRLFTRAGLHPYISIQDFDTSSRAVEGVGAPHIFTAIDRRLYEGPRPLMIAGGYRPGADLVDRTIARFPEDEVPAELTEDHGERFAKIFAEHIYQDMASRQQYAMVHPLLPYAPEPNLFLDALAVAYGERDLGAPRLAFGEGAAEFTQLAKTLGAYEQAELAHHYKAIHEDADATLDVAMIPDSEREKTHDLESIQIEEQESFIGDNGIVLDRDQQEIAAQLSIDAQTGRHPRRDLSYLVDFTGLAVETDLSRLAHSFVEKDKDPQSHIPLTILADRFFQDKSSKSKTSMAAFNKYFDPLKAEEREAARKGLLDPKSSVAKKGFMPFRKSNQISSALSTSFQGPFSGLSTGIQPSQKLAAFGAVARALPQAIERLAFLLGLKLKGFDNGTPMDGNCLYHAVIQAQNGGMIDQAAATALRQQAVTWALAPDNLPRVSEYAFNHGVQIDALIDTLSRNGSWAGPAGDLTPRIVSSAIDSNIRIQTSAGQIHVLQPLGGPAAATLDIYLDLASQHYSLPPQQQQQQQPDAEME